MSENKTLGQVYFEARYGDRYKWKESGENSKRADEKFAASIAAVADVVARRVFAEGMTAYLAEQDKPVEPPKPEAASEAGDWSRAEIDRVAGKEFTRAELAQGFREAAERHYGKQIHMLKAVISAGKESSRVEHAKRLADRLDAMEVRSKAQQESIEKLRAERDKLRERYEKMCDSKGRAINTIKESVGIKHTHDDGVIVNEIVLRVRAMKVERDNLAAELREVREAVNDHAISLTFTPGMSETAPWRCVHGPGQPTFDYRDNPTDAILAAWRATKGKEQGDGPK